MQCFLLTILQLIPVTDIDGAWSKELGLTVDLSGAGIGLGTRTTRYALVLDDLVVKYLGVSDSDFSKLFSPSDASLQYQVEPDPTQVTVSGAEHVLAAL